MLLSKLSKYVEISGLMIQLEVQLFRRRHFLGADCAFKLPCRDEAERSLGPDDSRWMLKLGGLRLRGSSLSSAVDRPGSRSQVSWVVALRGGAVFWVVGF